MGRRCAVQPCHERDLPEGHWFCFWHWGFLRAAEREHLAVTWGWRSWARALQETVAAIRRAEGKLPPPHKRW